MKHAIPAKKFGPLGSPMAQAVQTCVHCGFCLPTCPTYRVMGEEMDSPRGRIVLMKNVLEGSLPLENALPHIDACLGCLACETACPSGVHYRDLISPFRSRSEQRRNRTVFERVQRLMLLHTLPAPGRFRVAALLGRFGKPFARLMPHKLRSMLALLPKSIPAAAPLERHYRADGSRRGRVALLAGCVQQVLAPEINEATISLLTAAGYDVEVPVDQGCCGALAWHIGEYGDARDKALANLAAFDLSRFDAIVSNAAGCGSGLREYPLILRGTPHEAHARDFSAKVRDVSEFLAGHSPALPRTPRSGRPLTVAYHDACHLAHGQGVRRQPRQLLEAIDGVTVIELADPEICCGSAGTYNIDQPDTAAKLGAAKAASVVASGADYVVSGNIGCLTQLLSHLPGEWKDGRILHTAVFLDRARRGKI